SESIFSRMDVQIKEILSKIDKQKDKLIKESNIIEFRVYKSLISEFIQIINSKLQLKEQVFFDSVGRQKVLKNIDNIDSKIKELQKEFINDNKNDINIVNLMEEIKGLVVDTII
ncbi:MAG: DUF327 family protein, partial [Romboutsia sp.]|nr:DUF327 family protein [Romboutsia sp.]